MSEWFASVFSKFGSLSATAWAVLLALLILGAVIFVISRDKRRWSTRMIANAALCIALSFILSCIRLYRLPQGGSITLASMLPLFLFAYAYGTVPGMLTGAAYGVLQFIQDAYFVHPVELVLDYPLAFAMLGLAGIAHNRNDRGSFIAGIVLGTVGRFVCAFLSGIIFFGMYAPEGQNVFVYSAVYNGFYLIPEAAICIVLALVPSIERIARQLSFADSRR